jgi:hypothetical protein
MWPRTGLRWWVYNHLARVQWIRKLHELLQPFAGAKSVLAGAVSIGVLSFIVQSWAVWTTRVILAASTAIAASFAAWDYGIRWVDAPVGTFKRDIQFDELLQKPLQPTEGRPGDVLRATTEQNLAASLEHEAFSTYSSTPAVDRATRLGRWFPASTKSLYFMLRNQTVIGYSVIIPVSDLDANRYREGYLKEFGFVPSTTGGPPTAIYAQSLFLKRELQGRDECLGLPQRIFLAHLASLFSDGEFHPFCVLADSETWDGARFLQNLGFEKGKKSADGRQIFELDLRDPGRLNPDGQRFEAAFKRVLSANRTESVPTPKLSTA